MADVFFDTGNTGTFDYGLEINSGTGANGYGGPGTALYASGGTQGQLYKDPTYQTANQFGQVNLTEVCSDKAGGGNTCDTATARHPETEVTGGTTVGTSITMTQTILDTTPADGTSAQPYYKSTFTLAGVNKDRSWDKVHLFWGTGQCANDTVEGTVTRVVPIPAALPIIGAAFAGFGFAGWRQRQTTA